MLQAGLSLQVSGQDIWVGKGGKLAQYDWDSGKIVREISLPERGGQLAGNSSAPLLSGANDGRPLDPQQVEAQAQGLKLPAKIALPALLANAQHEQQLAWKYSIHWADVLTVGSSQVSDIGISSFSSLLR